jgi:hypothetical protein
MDRHLQFIMRSWHATCSGNLENATEEGGRCMKVYEVECRAVITVSEQDLEKAALHAAALFKDNPDLIYVRTVHEMNFEPAREDPSLNTRQNVNP